jgi:membrane protein
LVGNLHRGAQQLVVATREIVRELRERPLPLAAAFVRRVFDRMVDRFARNNLLTYASATAVQLLTAVIPLALLAFLLVGAFGSESYWRDELAPTVASRASLETYQAIDAVVEALVDRLHVGWLVFAVLIAVWEISGAVRTVMGALNQIFEHDETRPIWHRFGVSFLLAIAVGVCTLGALLVTFRGGSWVSLGAVQPVWTVVRWLVVVALLWAVVALLIRFAPDGHEPAGWVTFGGVLVIVAWIVATLVFGWWVTSMANYKTAFGTTIALLTLIGYLYTSSIVFLVGAQIDKLLREQAEPGRGPLDGLL